MATKKPTSEDEPIWEQQVGETSAAWEAFQIYFKQDKKNASDVAKQLHKSYTLIRRWKDRWFWEERCRAYENSLLRAEYEEVKKTRKRAAKNKLAYAATMQNLGFAALQKVDAGELTAKDLPLIMRMLQTGFEYEDIGREALLDVVEKELGDEADTDETEDVVVYVPDNGMGSEGT
jgi:hypothetical protein